MLDAIEELSKLGRYGLLSIMTLLIALTAYSVQGVIRATEKTTDVARECATLHKETNNLLRENALALTQLKDFLILQK